MRFAADAIDLWDYLHPVVRPRVPSVFALGTAAHVCARRNIDDPQTETSADAQVRCGQERRVSLRSSSAERIAAESQQTAGSMPHPLCLVVKQFDTPPRGAGLTTVGGAWRRVPRVKDSRARGSLPSGVGGETMPWSFEQQVDAQPRC